LDALELTPDQKETWLRWLSHAEQAHRHVGWLPPVFWLGKKSSLYLPSREKKISACILASPDSLGTAWIHVFASDSPPGSTAAWEGLWPVACRDLQEMGVPTLWAMSTQSWFTDLLQEHKFQSHGHVVALSMKPHLILEEKGPLEKIRFMQEDDVESLLALDHDVFSPPWRMDVPAFRETFHRAALATVLISDHGEPIGYQLCIPTAQGVHLARLAVQSEHQGKGYGKLLTSHLINHFYYRRAPVITLNTQSDNVRSFHLYHSLGFHETGDTYPCFRYDLLRAKGEL
jgi:ribosomal protein S18 acetylase RimI-like enzyme